MSISWPVCNEHRKRSLAAPTMETTQRRAGTGSELTWNRLDWDRASLAVGLREGVWRCVTTGKRYSAVPLSAGSDRRQQAASERRAATGDGMYSCGRRCG